MMIARLSLLHNFPRLASMAPFLCLIVAQCEWPDMTSPSQTRGPSRRGAAVPLAGALPTRVLSGLQCSQFLPNLAVALILASRSRLVQGPGLAPRLRRLLLLALPEGDVPQVVPDNRVVVPSRQRRRLLQFLPRPRQVPLAEKDPAQAIDVGSIVP